MEKIKKYIPAGMLIVCFAILYYNTILNMVHDWSTNDNYSHGFLVPFIAFYLIWNDRDSLFKIEIKPSNIGLVFFIGSLLFFIITNIGAELFTMRFSMIFVLLSGVYFLFGKEITSRIKFAILYLVFMIPFPAIIWNKIAFPLKLYATGFAVSVIGFMKIPVYQEGNIIHLANTTLEVVDACSGLRSLVSLLALSAAFALIAEYSNFRKFILFLSAVPIAIILNIARLSLTAILARTYGPQVAQGFLHDISGIFIFVIAIIFLSLINRILTPHDLIT